MAFSGSETVEEMYLLPKRYGFIYDYNSELNPSIKSEFATVAFRFGHTLVQGMFKYCLLTLIPL